MDEMTKMKRAYYCQFIPIMVFDYCKAYKSGLDV